MAELPGMVYYQSDGGLVVNLYTQCGATIDLGGNRSIMVIQETDYPASGRINISITPSEAMAFPLRLRIPGWCPAATVAINDETAGAVSPTEDFCQIRRIWNPGDTLVLDMPMPWRWIRGRKSQEGRAALMRGPVVYCIGSACNSELLKQCEHPGDLILDPASLGVPVSDTSVRPGGLKVMAKAWAPGMETKDAPPLDVVLTEFVDPTCVTTYFRLPDLTVAVDDELKRGDS